MPVKKYLHLIYTVMLSLSFKICEMGGLEVKWKPLTWRKWRILLDTEIFCAATLWKKQPVQSHSGHSSSFGD
jgi:hypothetical protein